MTFDPSTALSAAKLAKRVYDVANVQIANARALVLTDPPRIAIAGTDDLEDMLQDARFDAWSMDGGGKVHRGFASHYNALSGPMWGMWKDNGAKPSDGAAHSLGAAAMVIAIIDLPEMYAGKTVHLFGCPTVGNLYFAEEFARVCSRFGILVFNVQARGDPVCTPLGRVHVGNVVEIGKGWDLARDHGIDAYIRDLEAML